MDSARQYIDLYHTSEETLCKGSNDVMNALRRSAIQDFAAAGFSTKKAERYKYTNVAESFAPDYGMNLARVKFPFDPRIAYRCSIPNIGTTVAYMLNDTFCEIADEAKHYPENVFIGSIGSYCKLNPERLGKLYGTLAQTQDAITAFNTTLAQDGLLIYIPASIKMEQVVQIVNLAHSSVDLLTNRRVIIVLEDGAKASVLFCEHTMDKCRFLTTSVIEIFIGKGSSLNLYSIDECGENSELFENIYVKQDSKSHFEYCNVTLHSGLIRRQLDQKFAGPNGEANIMGAVVADGNIRVDNNQLIEHAATDCKSEILYKYVLDNNARGAYAGKVLVREGAVGTDSHQSNANLCVSPTARMFTQPMLEI